MKLEASDQWCESMAKKEQGHCVNAGILPLDSNIPITKENTMTSANEVITYLASQDIKDSNEIKRLKEILNGSEIKAGDIYKHVTAIKEVINKIYKEVKRSTFQLKETISKDLIRTITKDIFETCFYFEVGRRDEMWRQVELLTHLVEKEFRIEVGPPKIAMSWSDSLVSKGLL